MKKIKKFLKLNILELINKKMFVINRKNEREAIRYDKITDRNVELSLGLNVNPAYLSKLVIESLKDGMTTSEIDELSAETSFFMSTYEPDYDVLATRISVSNLHKQTLSSFSETVKKLYYHTDKNTGRTSNIISDTFMSFVEANSSFLDEKIDYSRDYNYNYFGFKTLCRMYLHKLDGKIVERPQHMLMRVAVCIHLGNIEKVFETYEEMSKGTFTHASPTLFNAGSKRAQLASCFLLKCEDDLDHIYETNKRSALISKYGGGIGIDITNVRGKGSVIHANNGKSDGLVPMCKVFNATANYCNQCFHPDTIIYTKNEQKPIKDVLIGDEVITIDGTYKPVMSIFINDINKEILKVRSTYSFEDVKVTKEHQIYCIRGQNKKTNFNVILNRLNKGIIKPTYISAEDLTTDDFIGFPLQYIPENDMFENLGNDFFRFYGAMLGDGHICSNRNEAGITLNSSSKIDTLVFIKEYLKNRNINYWENYYHTNCVSIRWTNTNSGLRYEDLYDENKDKRINTKYFNISRSHRINIIKGLFETDGSNSKELYFSSTSYKLAHNLRELLLSLGILSSGNIRDDRGREHQLKDGRKIISKKIAYILRISKHPIINEILDVKVPGEFCKYFIHNNIIWSRVKRISKEHYEGKVYDLSILNNNNYVVGSLGLVHNSGRRKGSIAMYLQPWHPDILEFLALRYNNPPEELRARDLFTAMWIPDIFMRRVEADEIWSLIDPNSVRELCDTYGDDFDRIYEKAEKEGKFVKQIKAREVWKEILHSQQETGLPYIAYKDSINRKNNQMNIGLIRSGNLCLEIVEFTDTNSVATCNLLSVSLPSFVKDGKYNFSELGRIVKIGIKNLNNVIDRTYYPVVEAETNNLAYRPVGLGIQGLADVFSMFKLPWGCENATKLNRLISEVIYYYALEASHEFAIENEKIYSAFEGSPVSKGILQYDMWGVTPLTKEGVEIFGETLKLDWEGLKEKCKKGISNSLLIALMPTATSSQILGNNECLTGDTHISLTNGLSVKIEDFIENNKVLSFDEDKKTIISSDKINLINQGIKNVLELTFQDGTTIRCTEDHKFLTKEGWIEAKELLNKKIISSYKGILDIKLEDEYDYLLDIKPNCLYMKTDREKLLALSRIIGYLTGDGHIEKDCKTMTLYFGCKQDVNMFYNDLTLFTNTKPKIQKNTRGFCVDVPVELKNILKQFNLTEGRKSTSSYKHPDFILDDKCPLSIVREYIAGHFGADGVSPFLCKPKKQTSFIGSIALGHDVDENNIDSLKTYMEQLQTLLLKFNITSTIKSPRISSTKRIRTEEKFYTIVISLTPGSNFGERIGFRYCWSKMIRCCIGTSYYKYRENVLKQRQHFSSYVDTSILSVKKAIEKLNQDYKEAILYGSLLKEHYKRNKGTTNLKNFKGYSALEYINLLEAINYFEDPYFIKDDKEHISLPTFTFTVIHIKKIEEPQKVYDISVNSTHNFIANSVVVHNCFEPVTSNIYTRSTNSGDYIIVNKHLAKDLKEIGLWNKDIVNKIIENNGSVQNIDGIPDNIKEVYKTVWEISQKVIIDYAADRAPFVDQTQSMNIFIDQPSYAKLSSMHLYGWKKGLKTGSYYIRSKPSRDAVKFTILKEKKVVQPEGKKYVKGGKEYVCTDDVCVACSS